MHMSEQREGKGTPSVKKNESNTPVEEVPRTNTGVEIDNPEKMESPNENEGEKETR